MKKNGVVFLAVVGFSALAMGLLVLGKYVVDSSGIGRGEGTVIGKYGFSLKNGVTQTEANTSFSEFKESNPLPPGLRVEIKIESDGTYIEFVKIRQATFYQDKAFLADVHSWYIDSLVGYMVACGVLKPKLSPHSATNVPPEKRLYNQSLQRTGEVAGP